jgi:hypothetical protein
MGTAVITGEVGDATPRTPQHTKVACRHLPRNNAELYFGLGNNKISKLYLMNKVLTYS